MNFKLLILTSAIAITGTSCNSVYKGMETPDDVYLASGRTVEKAVVRYESEYDNDVRYTRMRCRSSRYRFFNEYDYNYSPYSYGYNYAYYYNPYYYPYPVFNSCACINYGNSNFYTSSTPIRTTNLNSYHTNNINVIKTKSLNTYSPSDKNNSSSASGSQGGSRIRRFISSVDGGGTGNDRSYSPSGSSSSSSGTQSGSSITRPSRN